ncbi:hypothetical protein GUITHDRAFT_133253 [Guillardia theta CCMP2712]|uniref:Phospholipid/glycerol acyltransferase domain-containing protein n=1 Tax=Guillardia theta (strain CCMP2712) TaxID=905079 RepID=L1JXL6_GUITC|nr:hypothetical protein GUITHDRAFT_133253 [Guillardia theta CCMP2712]EKX52823.1 hypothetical protein GUITHDRAFT_133253 [Guillardia theta CCMP2712]|eukprot:XP_005839803.1 hypothetical protein GUITHDRAFT_133253 [Guillardia theta CCMP2712]
MEKFRSFEDPASGIMPFMPEKVVRPKNILLKVFRGLIGLCLGLVKFPVCAILFLLFILVRSIFELLPIAFLRRPMIRIVDVVCCRLLLLLLGFWWIPAGYPKKKTVTVSRAGAKQTGWPPLKSASSGSILLSTLCSYVDVLYLCFRFSPVFVFPVQDKGKSVGKVLRTGPLGAIRLIVGFPSIADRRGLESISHVVANSKSSLSGPVVLFPEGVSSNGQGILPFLAPVGPVEVDPAAAAETSPPPPPPPPCSFALLNVLPSSHLPTPPSCCFSGSPLRPDRASRQEGSGPDQNGLEQQAWMGGKVPDCYALTIRYSSKHFSPIYTVQSFFSHAFGLCAQLYNSMEVTCLEERATELKAVDQGLTPSQRDGSSWSDRLRTAMCAAASSPAKSVRCVCQ